MNAKQTVYNSEFFFPCCQWKIVSGASPLLFCYNYKIMGGGKKNKKLERPIFDAIRKPTAPPGQKIGKVKPEVKIHPSLRKLKHRKKEELDD
jgi:hypothetical protein